MIMDVVRERLGGFHQLSISLPGDAKLNKKCTPTVLTLLIGSTHFFEICPSQTNLIIALSLARG